jgi:hypothetical protein
MVPRTGSYVGLGLAVAVLAACGPQPQGGTAAPAGTPEAPSSSVAAPGGTASPTLTPQATPSTPSGPDRCHTGDLGASLGRVDAGAGNRYAQLTLTNRSGRTCVVFGYGGVLLLDAARHPVPTKQIRNTQAAPKRVTLSPGAGAHSTLHWGVVPDGSESTMGRCEPSAAFLQIIPPDETQPLTIAWPEGPVCQHGRIDQSPYAA